MRPAEVDFKLEDDRRCRLKVNHAHIAKARIQIFLMESAQRLDPHPRTQISARTLRTRIRLVIGCAIASSVAMVKAIWQDIIERSSRQLA